MRPRRTRPRTSSDQRRQLLFGEASEPAGGLREAARSGSRWTALQQSGARFTTTVVFLILARLLQPAEFGVVALATVIIGFLQLVVEGGFGQAIVQRRTLLPGHVDTVFWTSVGTGSLLAGAMVLGAEPVGRAFSQPQLTPVLRVLALALVLSSLGAAQVGLLRRSLQFKPLAVRAIVSNVVAGVGGVTAAFLGWGAWALVVQYVLLSAVQTTMLWGTTGWRPGLDVSWAYFMEMFRFSRNMLGNALLQFTNQRSDDFLVGSRLGSVSLGIYTVAYRLVSVMSDLVDRMMMLVTFPLFARLQDDGERLSRAYRSVLRLGTAVAFPSYLFFVVAAPDVIRIFFGAKWEAAAPVMRILAVFGAMQTALSITDACLNAIGKPHVVFRNRLATTTVQVAAFVVAAPFGLRWVAFSLVARAYLMAPLPVWSLRRAGVSSYRSWLSAFVVPLTASAVMLAAMQGARSALPAGAGSFGRLGVVAVAGVLVYGAVLRLLDRALLEEILHVVRIPRAVRRRRGRHRPAAHHRVGTARHADPLPVPSPPGDGLPSPTPVAADGRPRSASSATSPADG